MDGMVNFIFFMHQSFNMKFVRFNFMLKKCQLTRIRGEFTERNIDNEEEYWRDAFARGQYFSRMY